MIVSVISVFVGSVLCASIPMGLHIGAACLLTLPDGKGSALSSFMTSAVYLVVSFSILLWIRNFRVMVVAGSCMILANAAWSLYDRYRTTSGLFQYNAPLLALAAQVRLLSISIWMMFSFSLPMDKSNVLLYIISILLQCSLYAALLYRSLTGRCMIFARGTEKMLKELLKGNLKPTSPVNDSNNEELGRMMVLYKKVLTHMEINKPFLNPKYSLADLSRDIGTNKTYLSRTINVCSGKNFNQFVNWYRVDYAVDLMKKDRCIKVKDLGSMSGFHNNVSFNMAFKMFYGVTPGEFTPL